MTKPHQSPECGRPRPQQRTTDAWASTFIARALLSLFLVSAGFACAAADQFVTITVTVTGVPADADTITINGSTRTWKTVAATPTTQIAITNNAANGATNLFTHFANNPTAVLSLGYSSSTQVRWVGKLNQAMTASIGGTWGTFAYSTNLSGVGSAVRWPISAESSITRTNVASSLVEGIDNWATNAFSLNTPALRKYIDLSTSQAASNKTFRTSTWNGGYITNALRIDGEVGWLDGGFWSTASLDSPVMTNGVNYGTPFSSPGSALHSEQFGDAASATAVNAIAISGLASGLKAVAVGRNSTAQDTEATALGTFAQVVVGGTTGTSIGAYAYVNAPNATALGSHSTADYARATAIGYGATARAADEVAFSASQSVWIPVSLQVDGSINGNLGLLTNGTLKGSSLLGGTFSGTLLALTNGWAYSTVLNAGILTNAVGKGHTDFAGDVNLQRLNNTSLANGNNAGLDFKTNSFVKIKAGPTAAFTINGISGGRDGRLLIIRNSTTQNMTIANESGVDATAANRILTDTGGDITSTGEGSVTLIYDSDASRWIVTAWNP